jgi:hypothetical protein
MTNNLFQKTLIGITVAGIGLLLINIALKPSAVK